MWHVPLPHNSLRGGAGAGAGRGGRGKSDAVVRSRRRWEETGRKGGNEGGKAKCKGIRKKNLKKNGCIDEIDNDNFDNIGDTTTNNSDSNNDSQNGRKRESVN